MQSVNDYLIWWLVEWCLIDPALAVVSLGLVGMAYALVVAVVCWWAAGEE